MRPSRSLLALALLALPALWSPTAWADPKDDARRAFNEGLELIAAGDYDGGIERFVVAYELVPHPAVLFNIARAYTDAGDYENAILWFERYLETEPIDRTEVEGYIGVLRSRLDAVPLVAEPEPAATPAAPLATADELAELRRHAEELQALADALAAREQAAREQAPTQTAEAGDTPPEQPSTDTPASTSGAAPADGPPTVDLGGELARDLYSRVVVTSSRFGQDPLESPSAITVITADDIEMSGASSLPEILASVPGMDVMQLSAGQADVSVRGFNIRLANKLLVLIDGRSIYLDFVGTTMWETLPITLSEIERIEVIRGPGSAIYGANAFVGVVNIITKAPGDLATHNELSASVGTRGYGSTQALVSGREQDLGYRFSASYKQVGRWEEVVDLEQRPDISSDVQDQALAVRRVNAGGQMDWRLGSKAFASLSGGLSQGPVEFYAIGALRGFYLDQTSANLRADAGYGPLHLRGYYNRVVGDTGSWYYPTGGRDLAAQIDSQVLDFTLDGDFELGAQQQHVLSVGLNYRYKTIDWGFLESDIPAQHHASGFIQDQSTLGRFTISGVVRADRHPLLDKVIASPRLAVVTSLGEGRALRLNGGTAFRTPTFMESYADLYLATGVESVVANTRGDPALKPERITALEFGYQEQSADWRAEIAAYGYQVDDLINLSSLDTSGASGFVEDAPGYVAGTSWFANEDPVYRAAGGELVGEYFGLPGLDLSANYALEFMSRNADGVQERLRATPRHKINASVAWRSPWRLDMSMQLNWVDKQVWPIRGFDASGQVVSVDEPVSGYTILSNRLALRATDNITLSASAWNWLADVRGAQPQHPLGQAVGSRYQGTLQYRF